MARNNKPLRILVSSSLYKLPRIQELITKGHVVVSMSDFNEGFQDTLETFDIIFSEKAWRMTEGLASIRTYVDSAVKACRAVKYRKQTRNTEEDDD